MYVIVEIAGLQYKVEKDQQLYVNRLEGNEGDSVSFDRVLLSDNGSISVGAPVIEGALVEAKILEHLRGDKVIVFKKKRRKGYQKKNGFRAALTKIEITGINGGSGKTAKKVDKTETKAKAAKTEKAAAPAAEKETKVEAKEVKADDLTVIEGIGPQVQEILNENGIKTYKDLAESSAEDIKALLAPKGGVYAGMEPGTWPEQAALAAEGKMDELKKWQDDLNAGQ